MVDAMAAPGSCLFESAVWPITTREGHPTVRADDGETQARNIAGHGIKQLTNVGAKQPSQGC